MRRGGAWRVALGSDRGSGTVWVLAFAAVIWVGGVAAIAVGGVRGVRHRADAAADLAALAGAARAVEGAGVACDRAKSIAAEYRTRLTRCRVRGEIVEVWVTADMRVPMGIGELSVVSRARAGPPGAERRSLARRSSLH
ncbi:Rv3654c family TadE-like protein [Actinomadura chibensis]|uniref:Flp pilus-assembly TadE/G-like family protein n=1 Tax=Actinomadura chibensis TaxID=392828 RepID=A0A5D0NZN6_9ACTN|nr:Rv3654c family TadE-like protein [Actinomadura chibensis]TYB49987.1 flp pilus-assembly TadE/G-like family protein [Actinomadura chibensis]